MSPFITVSPSTATYLSLEHKIAAPLYDIGVVSILLLVQVLASLNCVVHRVPLFVQFPSLCDRYKVSFLVACFLVWSGSISRLISGLLPVQHPTRLNG